jgi:hypothetical protein
MRKSGKLTLVRIAAAFAAAGMMVSAQAALVPSWDYEVVTIFNGTNTFTSGTGSQIETQRQVSWGDPAGNIFAQPAGGRSGISISDGDGAPPGGNDTTVNPNTGNVVTNDLTNNIGLGAWITHHNNPISGAFATLRTSQIDSSLSLWAVPPGNTGGLPDTGPSTLTFTVFFAETPNATPCTIASSPTPCNDIFALNQAQAFNQQFTYNGDTYFVSIFPIVGAGLGSFTQLPAAACADAGAAPNCIGFTTVEGQNTTIRFGFAITAQPISIPEPGTLALLGGSLFGLAALRRRRKA